MADPLSEIDASKRQPVRALLNGWSIEIPSRDIAALAVASHHLEPGTDVYLNWIAGDTHHRTVAAATKLRRAGLNPVPHIAARYLASFSQLADFLSRLAGEARVDRALVVAGDRERPVGPFESSLKLIETGLFQKYRFTRIGIAGYPEGSRRISGPALEAALAAKLDSTKRFGLEPHIVTQFCFEAEPIVAWLRKIREWGITVPVRIGLAGPASITTLMKYALRCGVGNSLRALGLHGPSIAHILTRAGPESVIRDLARSLGDDRGSQVDGIHFYSFGGFARTADWARAAEHSGIPPDADRHRGESPMTRDRRPPGEDRGRT